MFFVCLKKLRGDQTNHQRKREILFLVREVSVKMSNGNIINTIKLIKKFLGSFQACIQGIG